MEGMIMWSPGVTLEAIEKQVIAAAYKHFQQNKTATANALGIAIRTLDSKLEKYAADLVVEKEREQNAKREREKFLARQRGNLHDNIDTGSRIAADAAAADSIQEAASRVRLEPASQPASKQAVSVSQRKKV